MRKKLASVIDARKFDTETIEEIFRISKEMEEGRFSSILRRKIMASVFYEASTRTRLSFESAMKRLGGEVIGTENARQFSSKAKGETLEDTMRIISGYSDVIVLRYHKEGGAERAKNFSQVPVINAGDGTGQHPTQALLDLYTIKKKFRKIDGLKIAMSGDLANGRTVRSLCYLLAKHLPNNEIIFVSPALVKMGNDIKEYLSRNNVKWREVIGDDFESVLSEADVFYQTRVQSERFNKEKAILRVVLKEAKKIVIHEKNIEMMKKDAIIMHPLPRLNEISYAVDKNHRSQYFQQAQNGLFVRMALLKMILIGY